MNHDVKLAYLVYFDRPIKSYVDCLGLVDLRQKYSWLSDGESFISFALRILVGRLR